LDRLSASKDRANSLAELERVLSTLRHQFGNSVNALRITLDVLEEGFDRFHDQKKREYVQRASKLVARQQIMIEALKSYSRFKVERQKAVPFPHFLEQFLAATSDKLRDRNIKVIRHFGVPPCAVVGDEMALRQVMMNLLENAMEALEGLDHPTIQLYADRTDGGLMVLMKDNGPGIDQEDKAKIFLPLYTNKPGRLGMGLPVARKLLQEMGGHMELESEVGRGTAVRIWLRSEG
jgi:two-component system C4-dicarboxylate transport sensor histidine kinase DctB